jgi:hypothetical protein
MRATLRPAATLLALAGLALAAPACGGDDGATPATTTAAPTTSRPTTTTEPDRTEERAELVIAPVVASGGCPADAPEPSATGPFPTADGAFCFTIGEPIGDGNDLTDATLSEAGGAYQVMARARPESADTLNAGFNACFTGAPDCPPGEGGRGVAAIVWDGTTLYAPAIQVEDLADGPFALAGGLTEREARKLITLINR